jgi:hypothetical protein
VVSDQAHAVCVYDPLNPTRFTAESCSVVLPVQIWLKLLIGPSQTPTATFAD